MLSAQLEMFNNDWCVRTICPHTMTVSEDFTQVMFTDMRRVLLKEKSDEAPSALPEPYCPKTFTSNYWRVENGVFGDEWSVAIILLEILVGSRFLICLDTLSELKTVVYGIKRVIDQETAGILERYLLLKSTCDVKKYVENTLVNTPDLIGENIRIVKETIPNDKILSDLKAKTV